MTEREYKIYRKVQHEFYVDDARVWCNDNGVEYDDELLNYMAESVSNLFDCNISYWDNFANAYLRRNL